MNTIEISRSRAEYAQNRPQMLDTTFVLFFLAMEFGRTLDLFSFDAALMLTTLAMVAVLPFYVIADEYRPAISGWIAGRAVISLLGLGLGVAFSQTIGIVIPESLRFFPMTLLIFASMVSCLSQFYGLLKIRPAK
jgi:hypothetical protein